MSADQAVDTRYDCGCETGRSIKTGAAFVTPCGSHRRPKGGIEQARRNFMRDDPELYAYIEARVAARELQRGAGDASGATDNYGAANRLYANAARWEQKWRDMLPDGPS